MVDAEYPLDSSHSRCCQTIGVISAPDLNSDSDSDEDEDEYKPKLFTAHGLITSFNNAMVLTPYFNF
jgi:hypothetical protein